MDGGITAFLAKSFAREDQPKLKIIEDFLSSFRPQGFFWESAERAEVESVSRKVRNMIASLDVFVGIFTKRHPIYSRTEGLKAVLKYLSGRLPVDGWTVPPWLLQESGYALALKKDLIIFREVGVQIATLQGDLEYIEFDVSNPAPAFQRASEMINGLMAARRGISVTYTVQAVEGVVVPSPESISTAPIEEQVKSEQQDTPNWEKLNKAIDEKDWKVAKEVLEKLIADEPGAELRYRSYYLFMRYLSGDSSALDSLIELYEAHPTNVAVSVFTARCYEIYKHHEKAVEYLKRSADASAKPEEKRAFLLRAARTLKDGKNLNEAKSLLFQLLSEGKEHQTPKVLKELFDVLRMQGETYEAIAVGELALSKNPVEQDLRFSVGLDYHQLKQFTLFLSHYKIYCGSDQASGGFNNLGLAYEKCELPIHAVDNYQHGYELGDLHSTRNLAYQYLYAGFANEASRLLETTIAKKPESVGFLGRSVTDIEERREQETEKEEELLAATEKYRQFAIAFGQGLISDTPNHQESVWHFRFGDLPLRLSGNVLSGTAEIKRTQPSLSLALAALGKAGPDSDDAVIRYSFHGSVTGKTCKFEIEEELIEPTWRRPDTKERKGYLVFDPSMQTAQIMEVQDDKWKSPYTIKRAQQNTMPV